MKLKAAILLVISLLLFTVALMCSNPFGSEHKSGGSEHNGSGSSDQGSGVSENFSGASDQD